MYDESGIIPPMEIDDHNQEKLLIEAGYNPLGMNEYKMTMLDVYRCTHGWYKNDPDLSNLIVYMKHDYTNRGCVYLCVCL